VLFSGGVKDAAGPAEPKRTDVGRRAVIRVPLIRGLKLTYGRRLEGPLAGDLIGLEEPGMIGLSGRL
jgi:hypothetical protein